LTDQSSITPEPSPLKPAAAPAEGSLGAGGSTPPANRPGSDVGGSTPLNATSGSAGGPGTGQNPPAGMPRFEKPLPLKPRRVRGGVKLSADDESGAAPWAASWAAQRWIRLVEQAVEGKRLVEGLEYARLGQTKSMIVEHGAIVASVQGRMDRPYATRLVFGTFNSDQWHQVVRAMSDQAVYAAKLLANELPASVDDVLTPLGLKLFASEVSEVTPSCTCTEFKAEAASGKSIWCKHAACVAYLFAERVAGDPFVVFKLKGLDGEELLERLRHTRAVAGAGRAGTTVYAGRVPGVSDMPAPELTAEAFWDAGPELESLTANIAPPAVHHPLLRRLGPSPLPQAKFPLVGLLASCYETISEQMVRERAGEAPAAPSENDGDEGESE